MASATAAGSAYSTHGEPMIPFYIFYSMFGFQRTGDSIWAMADQLARGFLIGATAGRTTLTGEGLQHADGHSPLLALTNPAVVHYDPAFAYEIAHIVQDGLAPDVRLDRRRTRTARTSSSTSPSTTSRSASPTEPEDLDVEGLLKGIHHVAGPTGGLPTTRRGSSCSPPASGCPWIADAPSSCSPRTGASAPTCGRSRRGTSSPATPLAAEEWNLLHPVEEPRTAVRHRPADGRPRPGRRGQRLHARRAADRSRAGCPADYHALGADGFGFADTRPAARRFFQIDAESVVVPGARGAGRARAGSAATPCRRRSTTTASTTRPRCPA